MSEPEQLDLLDWLAAQPPSRPAAETEPGPARDPTLIPSPAAPDPVLLSRIDPDCNMHRFYGLVLASSLFGEHGVVRHWGRIGTGGQSRTDWYKEHSEAQSALQSLLRAKRRRGYVP